MNVMSSIHASLKFSWALIVLLCFASPFVQVAQAQCSDPVATLQYDNSATLDDCCWFININNQNVPNLITALRIDNLAGCQIGSLTSPGGWTVTSLSSTSGTVVPPGGFIQPGSYFQEIRVCISDRTTLPQTFDLSFLQTVGGSYQTYCTSNIAYIDCPINSEPCEVDACFIPDYQGGTTYDFINCSSGNGNLTYAWDFGDGNNSTQANPNHTYTSNQPIYTVCLTVTNDLGNGNICKETICQEVDSPVSCDLEVILPDQITICQDESILLTPQVFGATGAVNYSWSPAAGLSNPNIANPVATPGASTTYTVTAIDAAGCVGTASVNIEVVQCPCNNQVDNGDFESGDTGFTSGLTSDCSCGFGTYCVTTNAKLKCNNALWNPILAPSGSGNYMVVDGDVTTIWSQNVSINAGSVYDFCFDYYPNVSDGGTPTLSVDIFQGGSLVANLGTTSGTSMTWQKICFNGWNATLSGTVELRISQTDAPQYSDYGIDNIEFGTCCELELSLAPEVEVCEGGFVQLSPFVAGASGAVSYSWSPATGLSDPNIDTPNASPSSTTTYTLVIEDELGCTATAEVTVVVVECPCDELVVNGDFSAGNTGFTSGLPSVCDCQSGSYCVTTNAKLKCNNSLWNPILAPGGSGNYLVVDGRNNTTIWNQTVNVNGGLTYYFCFDYYPNVSGGGTPELTVEIVQGGSVIATLGATKGSSGSWQTICFSGWTATVNGSVELRIRQTTAPQYSDYGIDNIRFSCKKPGGDHREAPANRAALKATGHDFPTKVLVYPNPTKDQVTVQLGESINTDLEYELIDALGKVIQRGLINQGSIHHAVNLDRLPTGIYFLRMGNAQVGFHQERIIKN
ncbi:MAG: T9SS type A sorting domain-containing protein [Bacteroidota bacterium]